MLFSFLPNITHKGLVVLFHYFWSTVWWHWFNSAHSSLLQFSSNYISSYTRHFHHQFPYASKTCKDQFANSKFGYQIIAAVEHIFLLLQTFLKWKNLRIHQASFLTLKHTHICLTRLACVYGEGWGTTDYLILIWRSYDKINTGHIHFHILHTPAGRKAAAIQFAKELPRSKEFFYPPLP